MTGGLCGTRGSSTGSPRWPREADELRSNGPGRILSRGRRDDWPLCRGRLPSFCLQILDPRDLDHLELIS
ncbi:hypothetical protein [Streptomyces vastus]|uniref:hypothetical protein n=1 Tax=Streptomyces vastus TaxID=285451 RepID=UPI0031DBCBCF